MGEQAGRELEYPMVPVRKSETVGVLAEHAAEASKTDREEHWRLLYVAMTRAEEHLVAAGTLGPQAKGEVPESSWHYAIGQGMMALDCDWQENSRWGKARVYGSQKSIPQRQQSMASSSKTSVPEVDVPAWMFDPAPEEARPPKPLAPSDLGPDDTVNPPASSEMQTAARRGVLLHSLFQRLPAIDKEQRAEVADHWLEKNKGFTDDQARQEMIETTLAVMDDQRWSDLFAQDSLAEAPIAAVVGEQVISGTVDRLMIGDHQIVVVDFKTGRKVPETAEQVPIAYLRQMAAYVAALGKIFSDRPVKAALLYSHGPKILELPAEIMERHKPGLERS